MTKIIIEPAPFDKWEEYKKIRLESLKEAPSSFGSSYENELKITDEEWKRVLLETQTRIILWAKKDNEVVGMVGAFWGKNEKTKHVATIWGLYVNSKNRRQNIGQRLMENILKELKNNPEILKITLSVVTENIGAMEMYKKLGFEIAGEFKKEIKVDSKYYDEYVMEKFFRNF